MRARRLVLIAAIVVTTTTAATRAQSSQPIANPIHREGSATAASTAQSSTPATLDTSRVMLALVAVLGLIFLLRFGIRKFAPGVVGRTSRGIRVVARTYLGAKQQVIVLQVGRRMLVVGDTGQNLNTLCEITDPDEAATLLAQIQGNTAESSKESFTQAMGRASEQYQASSATTEPSNPVLDSARTELNGLAERVRILSRHLKQA